MRTPAIETPVISATCLGENVADIPGPFLSNVEGLGGGDLALWDVIPLQAA